MILKLNFSLGRRSAEFSKLNPRPAVQRPTLQQRAPQSSSGPDAPRRGYLPIRPNIKHRVDLSQPQADQRNANKPKLGERKNDFLIMNTNTCKVLMGISVSWSTSARSFWVGPCVLDAGTKTSNTKCTTQQSWKSITRYGASTSSIVHYYNVGITGSFYLLVWSSLHCLELNRLAYFYFAS